MKTSLLTTAALLVASLAAAWLLTGPEPVWVEGAGAMIAAGHLILVSVSIVGALVGASRWARWLGTGLAAILAGPALVHPVTAGWIVMVAAAGLALVGLVGTGLRAVIRQRPPADAPPVQATALALGLLAAPIVVGAVQPGGVDLGDWAVAGGSVILAVWYTRARQSALWATRIGTPLLAIVSAFTTDWPEAVAPVLGFVVLARLAWSTAARVAVVPLAAPGRSVPIPAELTPGEILDAAGIDSHGRKKDPQ